MTVSMTQGGDPRDNGIAERVHRTLKTEFRYGQRKGYVSFKEVKEIINRNIEKYNNIRPHASIDYLTPTQAYCLEGPLKKKWKNVDWKKRKKRKKKTIILEDLYQY
nr:integrase core domain-containing protein [Flexithrix dorotheae]